MQRFWLWNRQQRNAYEASAGWQPYTGTSNPHTDHVHFSFSWAGARKQTTWWTGVTAPPAQDDGARVRADCNGDGRDDVAAFHDYQGSTGALWVWWANAGGGFAAPVRAWQSGEGNWDASRTKPV